MDADERLRLDYDQTMQLLRTLTDVRFKLLAFVPTIAGAAVGLVGHPRSAAELLGIGLLGLVATLGVFLYELRNSQVLDSVVGRAKELERRLAFPSVLGEGPGGLVSDRLGESLRFLGGLRVSQAAALSLVYGAAVGGWGYLLAWGVLRALNLGEAQTVGGLIGIGIGMVIAAESLRIAGTRD